jgi:hypothetical protein
MATQAALGSLRDQSSDSQRASAMTPYDYIITEDSSAALQRVVRSLHLPSTPEHSQLRWTCNDKRRRLFSMSHLLL